MPLGHGTDLLLEQYHSTGLTTTLGKSVYPDIVPPPPRVLEIIKIFTVFEIFQNEKLYHIELSNLNVY